LVDELHVCDDQFIIVGDHVLEGYNTTGDVKKTWQMELFNEIKMISFAEKDFAVLYGEKLSNNTSELKDTIHVYTAEGYEKMNFKPGYEVTMMNLKNNILIMDQGNEVVAYSEKGEEMWKYSTSAQVREVIFTDPIYVLRTEHSIICMKKVRIREE